MQNIYTVSRCETLAPLSGVPSRSFCRSFFSLLRRPPDVIRRRPCNIDVGAILERRCCELNFDC